MKKLLYSFFFLFMGINSYSQNEYIIDIKGKKIIIDNGSTQMSSVGSDKTNTLFTLIYYKQNGKKNNINFLDVKEARYGDYKIDTYKLAFDKEFPYFTLMELNGLKLVHFSKSKLNNFIYIIDNNNNVIEDLSFNKRKHKGEALDNKKRVDTILRKYFGQCDEFIRRLDRYKYNNAVAEYKSKFLQKIYNQNKIETNEEYNNLDNFFDNPILQECIN